MKKFWLTNEWLLTWCLGASCSVMIKWIQFLVGATYFGPRVKLSKTTTFNNANLIIFIINYSSVSTGLRICWLQGVKTLQTKKSCPSYNTNCIWSSERCGIQLLFLPGSLTWSGNTCYSLIYRLNKTICKLVIDRNIWYHITINYLY